MFVRPSSSYFESLQSLNEGLRREGKPAAEIVPADENLETEDILEMVHAGIVAITVADTDIARLWVGVLPGLALRQDLVLRRGGRLGPAIRKGSPRIRAALDSFLRAHGVGTAEGNTVVARYFKNNPWIRNPGAQADRRRFEKALPIFLKYARQYDFDVLLLAAQGFQESRIDQRVKSPVGAVGVMQVKPSTAAGPPINIKNVLEMEANIHAGVKYLRHLSDDIFGRESLPPSSATSSPSRPTTWGRAACARSGARPRRRDTIPTSGSTMSR